MHTYVYEIHTYVYSYLRMIYMYRRDLMVLNLRTLNWTELTPASPPPSGRSHLGMCAYDGKLFVFGQAFFKSPYTVASHSIYAMALTFEHLCQRPPPAGGQKDGSGGSAVVRYR